MANGRIELEIRQGVSNLSKAYCIEIHQRCFCKSQHVFF